jgi:RNA polymerase sigma-32 factor
MDSNRLSAYPSENRSRYFCAVRTYPMLSTDEEQTLCHRWRDRHDISAAHQLVASHLRLVIKTARIYLGYGLPLEDLVGEGQIGLMLALCRFDPSRGVRFSTYAICWVRAQIREYILRNWSSVKFGTTNVQKKLFFNLRRTRNNLQIFGNEVLKSEDASKIASILDVTEDDVIQMDQRMAGSDLSLNAMMDENSQYDWQSRLVDGNDDQETVLARREEAARRKSLLRSALGTLTTQEQHIIAERHLNEKPMTLAGLSHKLGITKDRVRQIEQRAITKLRRSVQGVAPSHAM